MTSSVYRQCGIGLLFLAIAIGSAGLASAQDDPATQFSATSNPTPPVANGFWSYGYENVPLPQPFNSLILPGPVPVIDAWRSPSFGEVGVYHNGTAVNQTFSAPGDNALYLAGELGMHPGPNDQYGVVQFTATVPGFYKINGTFEGLDLSGLTNTDVRLLWNNATVAFANVLGDGPGSDKPLSAGPFFLNANDTLAYAVGGNPIAGSTGLVVGSAFVDAVGVPEPSTLVLVGLGVVGLVGYAVRRRRLGVKTERIEVNRRPAPFFVGVRYFQLRPDSAVHSIHT